MVFKFWSKIGKKMKKSFRRKLKLDSNDAEYQANAEYILYVNIIFINRHARASAHERYAYSGGRCTYALMRVGAL